MTKRPDINDTLRNEGEDAVRARFDNAKQYSGTEPKPNGAAGPPIVASTERPWPKMGEAAFHGFAGMMIETIGPHSESDPVALLLQFLTCFGSCIGRSRYYQVESTRHYPNLFTVNVGSTSRARKGTALGRVRAMMNHANPVWSSNCIKSGLSSGEGFIYLIRDKVTKLGKDGNLEIVDSGVDDKRLLLVEEEFSAVLAVMERPQNTLSGLLRRAWDGHDLATATKNSPNRATKPHVSIIGHITIDELRRKLNETEMVNGFANRILFPLVRRSKDLPFGGDLPDKDIEELGNDVRWIIARAVEFEHGAPARLVMTGEARELWGPEPGNGMYHELIKDSPGLIGSVTARAEAQVPRLAMIYALLDKADEIDTIHLQAARAVWDYCEASARYIFGASTGDPIADYIMSSLADAGSSGMTRTEIFNLFGRNMSAGKISAALMLLSRYGAVRMEKHKQSGGGRPFEKWFTT